MQVLCVVLFGELAELRSRDSPIASKNSFIARRRRDATFESQSSLSMKAHGGTSSDFRLTSGRLYWFALVGGANLLLARQIVHISAEHFRLLTNRRLDSR